MADTISGGANYLSVFSMDQDHTTVYTTELIAFDKTISTQVNRSEQGGFDLTLDQTKDNAALNTFLETYAPVSETGEQEEITYEDGSEDGGATGGSPDVLCLVYGAVVTGGTERKVVAVVSKFLNTSGSYTQAANTFNRPTIGTQAQKAKVAVTIPFGNFNSSLVDVTVDQTIPVNSRGKVFFLTAAS